ncbi:hypothetical protein ABW19_dt0209076 [Dactylella cylindrospora]|nr:hypothetical protein ABW19_dt0209076 [Dactylella cylindrospora]
MDCTTLFSLPNEILHQIFEFISTGDLKSVALSCRTAKIIASPVLYRHLRINFEEEDEGDSEISSLTRSLESVLGASPQTLCHVKSLHAAHQWENSRAEIFVGWPESFAINDSILFKRVLTSTLRDQLRSIRILRTVSLATLFAILESQPNLRELELAGVAIPWHLKKFLSRGAVPVLLHPGFDSIRLDSFSWWSLREDMWPYIIKILSSSADSIRTLRFGIDRGPDVTPQGLNRLSNGADIAEVEAEVIAKLQRFQQQILLYTRKEKLTLPSLRRLHVHSIYELGLILDQIDIAATLDYSRISELRFDRCFVMDKFLKQFATVGENLQSLQLINCGCDWDTIRLFLPQMRPLHTLQLSISCPLEGTLLPIGCMSVTHHRLSLKRLWLECLTYHGDDDDQTTCPAILCFLGPGAGMAPLNSRNWPVLQELAIPSIRWDSMPLIQGLRTLRLLPPDITDMICEEHRTLIENYNIKLFKSSKLQYGTLPMLEAVVIGLSDEAKFFHVKFNSNGIGRKVSIVRRVEEKELKWRSSRPYLVHSETPGGFWSDA